jgi:hypothetical protein
VGLGNPIFVASKRTQKAEKRTQSHMVRNSPT